MGRGSTSALHPARNTPFNVWRFRSATVSPRPLPTSTSHVYLYLSNSSARPLSWLRPVRPCGVLRDSAGVVGPRGGPGPHRGRPALPSLTPRPAGLQSSVCVFTCAVHGRTPSPVGDAVLPVFRIRSRKMGTCPHCAAQDWCGSSPFHPDDLLGGAVTRAHRLSPGLGPISLRWHVAWVFIAFRRVIDGKGAVRGIRRRPFRQGPRKAKGPVKRPFGKPNCRTPDCPRFPSTRTGDRARCTSPRHASRKAREGKRLMGFEASNRSDLAKPSSVIDAAVRGRVPGPSSAFRCRSPSWRGSRAATVDAAGSTRLIHAVDAQRSTKRQGWVPAET